MYPAKHCKIKIFYRKYFTCKIFYLCKYFTSKQTECFISNFFLKEKKTCRLRYLFLNSYPKYLKSTFIILFFIFKFLTDYIFF